MYCEADLRLCFCIDKNLVFSRCSSNIISCILEGSLWKTVIYIPGKQIFLVPHSKYMYFVGSIQSLRSCSSHLP